MIMSNYSDVNYFLLYSRQSYFNATPTTDAELCIITFLPNTTKLGCTIYKSYRRWSQPFEWDASMRDDDVSPSMSRLEGRACDHFHAPLSTDNRIQKPAAANSKLTLLTP